MRRLIFVPIVHSESELGTMTDGIRRQFEQVHGVGSWALREPSVEAMWEGIRRRLLESSIHFESTRIYQDGLPICGRELDIARDVVEKGSRNYELVLELVDRGATLMGTESPELMIREYQRVQALLRAATGGLSERTADELKREGDEILQARDAFIAQRIETTLHAGETAIIFLGLLHRVDELLGAGYRIQHLIQNLPFRADVLRRLED